ncbi:hypothetical protein BST61_g11250 [Cercospora zeina]
MSLLSLPTELLDDIISQVSRNGDIESMALSCKRNYRLSKPHLKRYNELRPAWRHVEVGNPLSVLEVLVAIAREPLIARLIRTLDSSSAAPSEDSKFCKAFRNPSDPDYAKYDEARTAVRALVRASSQLALAREDAEDWIAMIMQRPREALQMTLRDMVIFRVVFLLTLLPNLERLQMPRF